MANHSYNWANIPLVDGCNPAVQNSYIMYICAKNFNALEMMQIMPVDEFDWIDPSHTEWKIAIESGDIGYVLDVDLEYPNEFLKVNNDYQLAPEALSVLREWLFPYQCEIVDDFGRKFTEGVKFVLRTKNNYLVRVPNLQLYLRLGMHICKINRVLYFRQNVWMAPYIQMNTDLRTVAINDFEKD